MATPRLNAQSVAPAARPVRQEGVAALGAVAQVANVFGKEMQRIDDLRVSEAELALRQRMRSAFDDPNDGFLTKKGTDAITGLDGFRDRLTTAVSDVEAGLTSDTQRALFRRRADALRADADSQAGSYVRRETERVQAETFEALNAEDMQAITANPANADNLIRAMDERTAIYADNLGKSPEVMRQARKEVISNARLAQVQALAAENPDRAKEILANHLEEIAPAKRQAAIDFVENANIVVQSQRIATDLYAAFGPDDERAALAEARKIEGKVGDEVVRRIETRYADDRRLKNQDIQAQTTAALSAIEAGQSVDVATYTYLEENAPQTLQALRTRQRQVANGTAPETDINKFLEVWGVIESGDLRAITELDMTAYKPYLTDRDWATAFQARRRMVQANNVSQNRPMTPARINEYAVQQMVGTGVLPGIAKLSDIKRDTPQYRVWTEMQPELVASIEAAQAEKDKQTGGSIPLTSAETQAAVQKVTDDLVIRTTGMPNRMMPRASLRDGDDSRELTAEERQSALGARNLARFNQRAQELLREGKTRDQIRTIMQGEGFPTSLFTETP